MGGGGSLEILRVYSKKRGELPTGQRRVWSKERLETHVVIKYLCFSLSVYEENKSCEIFLDNETAHKFWRQTQLNSSLDSKRHWLCDLDQDRQEALTPTPAFTSPSPK